MNLIRSIYDSVPRITARKQSHHTSKSMCWLNTSKTKYFSLRGDFLNVQCEHSSRHWMALGGRPQGAQTFLGEISPSLQCEKCWVIEEKKWAATKYSQNVLSQQRELGDGYQERGHESNRWVCSQEGGGELPPRANDGEQNIVNPDNYTFWVKRLLTRVPTSGPRPKLGPLCN